ncbi:MAG: ankyrin repeat domain-containing protein [Micavibrio sp.]|nr:ankyrin repeat domain-containing protein [Micavibrio sp.]
MLRPLPVKSLKKIPLLSPTRLPRTLRASFALSTPPMLGSIDTGKVLSLVDKGIDHNWTDKRGWTLLMIAIESMQPDVVKRLIEKGAKLDHTVTKDEDTRGMTPLHIAVAKGNRFSLQHLLDAKARLDAKDALGKTPLHYAVRQEIDKTQMLIGAGATIDARCKKGATPLMHAAAHQPDAAVTGALLDAGADPSLTEYTAGKSAPDYAALNQWGEKAAIEKLIADKLAAMAAAKEAARLRDVKAVVAQVATTSRNVKVFRKPLRFK